MGVTTTGVKARMQENGSLKHPEEGDLPSESTSIDASRLADTVITRISDWIATFLFAPYFFILLVLFHPLHLLASVLGQRAGEWVLLVMNRCFLWGLRSLAGMRLTMSMHPEAEGKWPLILVSNHQSMYDITLLLLAFNSGDITFVAKKELGRWIPSISQALRNMGAALIDRQNPRQSILAIRDFSHFVAKSKKSVCIFPEGTRSKDGQLGTFKSSGLAVLLKALPDTPVCPVAITGTGDILRRAFWPVRYGCVAQIQIGAPLYRSTEGSCSETKSTDEAAILEESFAQISAMVMSAAVSKNTTDV